jgi:hypothetical protein
VIYATIPLARAVVEILDQQFGREIIWHACLLLFVLGGGIAWHGLRHRRLPRDAYLWQILVLGIFAVTIYRLRGIPEEALHVSEYALLGVLVYRAFSHRLRDYTIYPLGVLLTAMVGIVDEYIQWVVPERYFDLTDIRINFFAGLLAQVGLVAGLRPRLVAPVPSAASWRRLGYWSAAALLLPMISFVNTPQRVAWYAKQVPGLEFLLDGNGMMAQYGYLHRSPSGGEFRSRFDAATLAVLDRKLGAEVARIVDQYLPGETYLEFLSRYSIIRDPYAHEVGVRMFRRIYHMDRVRDSPETGPWHYTVAYHENEILRADFPTALNASGFVWDASLASEVAQGANSGEPCLSKVSSAVITRVSEAQVWLLFGAGIGLVLGAGAFASRRLSREAI